MPPSEPPPDSTPAVAVMHSMIPGASSWTSLVAATALGLEAPRHLRVRAMISAQVALSGSHRLIVQMYQTAGARGDLPLMAARPVGCAQRVVGGTELQEGVDLDVVQFTPAAAGSCRIVAWLLADGNEIEDHMWARPDDAQWTASAVWDGREPVLLLLTERALEPVA